MPFGVPREARSRFLVFGGADSTAPPGGRARHRDPAPQHALYRTLLVVFELIISNRTFDYKVMVHFNLLEYKNMKCRGPKLFMHTRELQGST